MNKPRGINIVSRVVQIIKNATANYQAEQHKYQGTYIEHTNKHSNVIYCEQRRAEYVSNYWLGMLFQGYKAKASEEKFLKK